MSCPYQGDAEIYEKYLLNLLSDDKKKAFEQHLSECDSCQDKLRQERILIEGLRRIGNEEMKTEIRQQAAEFRKNKNRFSWEMMMRAAAVILFLVITPGLIYYYQYVVPQQRTADSGTGAVLAEDKDDLSEKYSSTTGQEETGDKLRSLQAEKPAADEIRQLKEQVTETAPMSAQARQQSPTVVSPEAMEPEPTAMPDRRMDQPAEPAEKQLSGEAFRKKTEDDRDKSEQEVFEYVAGLSAVSAAGEKSAGSLSQVAKETPTWYFSADGQSIVVNPVPAGESGEAGKALPDSFPVTVLQRDSVQLVMRWKIPAGMMELNPESIEVGILDDHQMNIFIDSKLMFTLDLKPDSSQARQVLYKPE